MRKIFVHQLNAQSEAALLKGMAQLGLQAEYAAIAGTESYDFAMSHQDALHFIWGGPLRRQRQNTVPKAPHLIWVEMGCGLAHYDALSFDAHGHGQNSSVLYSRPQHKDATIDRYKAWTDRHYWPQFDKFTPPAFGIPESDFILFGGQIPDDSVVLFDTPAWTRNMGLIAELFHSAMPSTMKMIIKLHPMDRTEPLEESPGRIDVVRATAGKRNDSFNDRLMLRCKRFITCNSSMVSEALARGVDVITLGTGYFTGNGVTKEVDEPRYDILSPFTPERRTVLNYLAEVCLYRQVHYADMAEPLALEPVFRRLAQVYKRTWGELPFRLA